jgi:hypothetical protein
MSFLIGLCSFAIGWALLAFGTWAVVLYGVVQMFRDDFITGFLTTIIGPIVCWAAGIVLAGAGAALMEG